MTTTRPPVGRHRLPPSPAPHESAATLLRERERRISDLLAAGHSVEHIIEIGRYQRSWDPGHVSAVLRARGLPPPPPRLVPLRASEIVEVNLAPRQADVLRLMCYALDNATIGKRLGIRENTVKQHVSRILQILPARDRLHAVVLVLTGAVRINLQESQE